LERFAGTEMRPRERGLVALGVRLMRNDDAAQWLSREWATGFW
jgi:hypothetical protein